jgi:hypothetical protein
MTWTPPTKPHGWLSHLLRWPLRKKRDASPFARRYDGAGEDMLPSWAAYASEARLDAPKLTRWERLLVRLGLRAPPPPPPTRPSYVVNVQLRTPKGRTYR